MKLTVFYRLLALAFPILMLWASPATAQVAGKWATSNPNKGWFFYQSPHVYHPSKPKHPVQAPTTMRGKAYRCHHEQSWTPSCGFIDPGTSFSFQAKERDALLQQMVMSHNDPAKIEAFQYYMKWVMHRAVQAANLWEYNVVQNPSLDPMVRMPINGLGLSLMLDVDGSHSSAIFSKIKSHGGFLVYFSRYNCKFCQAMDHILLYMEQDHHIKIWNTPIDGKCMPGFANACYAGKKTIRAAEMLNVRIVPSVFLYIPGGSPKKDMWMRVSTGLTDEQTLAGRIVSFFVAYRRALLEGIHNGLNGAPSVDFSEEPASGIAPGIPGRPIKPSGKEVLKLIKQ